MSTARAPKEGTEVVFRNLVGRKHLNGLTGTVVSHCDGSHEDVTSRCRVQVHGSGGMTVKVMPENFIPLSSYQRESESSGDVPVMGIGIGLLPTVIRLNLDKADDELTNATKRSLAESSTDTERMNAERKCLFPRDPRRLRHLGLAFFRDGAEDETHPANGTRKDRIANISRHTKREGYDWRARFEPRHRDPWTIPSDQGGFAPSNDSTDRELPVHPRLRSLLMGEEEEIHESLEWKTSTLYTGADHFAPVNEKPRAKNKAKAKASRNRADELFRHRAALSVKPVEEHIMHDRSVDAVWDAMTWSTESAVVEAGALMYPLEPSLSKSSSRETNLHSGFGKMEEDWKTNMQLDWEFCSSELDFERLLPDIKASPLPLPSDEAFKERAIHNMLQASTDEAEKGFDYGVGANKSTASLPWYESGELASLMLPTDGSTYVELMANSVLIADSLTLTASVNESDADWSEIAAIANFGST